MDRVVNSSAIVYDQITAYDPLGSYTRAIGVSYSDFVTKIFANNELLPWTMVDGSGIDDTQITSGFVYFNVLSTGYYGVRFLPDRVGYWNLTFRYIPTSQDLIYQYNVIPPNSPNPVGGLNVSFF